MGDVGVRSCAEARHRLGTTMAKRSQETRDPNTMATESTSTRRATRSQTKRHKREAATKDWKWLLWDSAFANEYLHQKLGASLTAVLKEACCVRAGVDKAKVNQLRKDLKDPLRLWPKKMESIGGVQIDVTKPFDGMVPTVSLLEWCVAACKYELSAKSFHATARGGDMDAVIWLHRNRNIAFSAHTCASAAMGGHLDVLKYLHENGCPWSSSTCYFAAMGGHLAMLKYLHENGCPWDEETCWAAAEGGHLDVLKYLHKNGCEWNFLTTTTAASNGHAELLKYAHKNGCPWFEHEMCNFAAKGGHLDVLKYVHKNGCACSEDTCEAAAAKGHLSVLKYLHENGCPWNERTTTAATMGGHLDVLKYAIEKGCSYNKYWLQEVVLFSDNAMERYIDSLKDTPISVPLGMDPDDFRG